MTIETGERRLQVGDLVIAEGDPVPEGGPRVGAAERDGDPAWHPWHTDPFETSALATARRCAAITHRGIGAHNGWRGRRVFIVGRVVAVDPPKRLSHTQRLTTRDDPFTLVTWELEETPEGTSVTLLHSGWPADTPKLDQVDATWAMILPELKRVVETGDISLGLKARYALMRAFMWAMPARTRTENVAAPE